MERVAILFRISFVFCSNTNRTRSRSAKGEGRLVMDDSWIGQEKEKALRRSEAEQKAIENEIFRREKLRRDAREFYTSFLAVFEKDVEEFNRLFPMQQERLQPIQFLGTTKDRFRLLRAYDPSYTLDVEFKEDVPSIHYTVAVPSLTRAGIADKASWEAEFKLSPSLNTRLVSGLSFLSLEDLSQRMLKPAIHGKLDHG